MAIYATEDEANQAYTIMVIFQRDVRMNKPFMPKLVYFEPKALDYPLGKELFEKFSKMDVEIRHTIIK